MILFGGEGLRNAKRDLNGTSVSKDNVPPIHDKSLISLHLL